MAIKYFYIDDDELSKIEEIAKGLSINNEDLIVQPYQHKKWGEQLDFIIDNQEEIDGILLDWGLTGKNEDGEKADFNVEALAQQIRRLTIGDDRKLTKDFPLVLCSAQYKFKEIFSKELTGHDLFDAVYEKSDFDKSENIIDELINLANGYKEIENATSAIELLGLISNEETDYRIIDRLNAFIRDESPIHEIARFILTKVVNITGVLIDEPLLAARLGVDLKCECDWYWRKLIKKIRENSYSGAFSKENQQWWSNKIEDWMDENSLNGKSPIEKVHFLNEKYGLGLEVAQKTEKSRSDDFWVVCKETNCPIALEDAIIALGEDKELSKVPWQEDEYYSIDTALEVDINLIHPSERERVQKLKQIHSQKRPRRR